MGSDQGVRNTFQNEEDKLVSRSMLVCLITGPAKRALTMNEGCSPYQSAAPREDLSKMESKTVHWRVASRTR